MLANISCKKYTVCGAVLLQWSPDNSHQKYAKNLCKLTKHVNCQRKACLLSARWCGRVDSMFTCQAGSTRLNLTAAQVRNPPMPTPCCLQEGCPEGKPAVYSVCMLFKCQLTWLSGQYVCLSSGKHKIESHCCPS